MPTMFKPSLIPSFVLLASLLGAPGALAQQDAPAIERRAVQHIVVQPGARAVGVRHVQVMPSAVRVPARAYEGVQQYRDWRWYGTWGPSVARSQHYAWTTRFAPVPRFYHGWGYAGRGYAGYPATRIWHR